MINKKKFFMMLLILLCINYASSLTLKINSISNFKCDSATGLLNFNLEAKEVTNDLKLQPFFLFLQQTGGELGYLSLCKLEDEEKLKSIAEGSNDIEDKVGVQLDILNEGEGRDAFIFLKKTVKPIENQIVSANFECSVENIDEFHDEDTLYVLPR